MGLIPFFGSSSNESKEVESKSRQNQSPATSRKSSNSSKLRRIMGGEDLDLRDPDVTITASHTSNHLNVAKTPLLEAMEDGVNRVEYEKKRIAKQLPKSEDQRLSQELQVAEKSSEERFLKADIDPQEKIIVGAELLTEASEMITERVEQMFEL
ncbi:MAG: hypothetical protein ABEJ72_07215, partial [Candidatus Aenigmatarchaeota archaeon]